MLADLLEFSANHLVDDGRLSFWMPTANDEDTYLAIPTHQGLDIVSVCLQPFNKCQLPLMENRSRLVYSANQDDRVQEASYIPQTPRHGPPPKSVFSQQRRS